MVARSASNCASSCGSSDGVGPDAGSRRLPRRPVGHRAVLDELIQTGAHLPGRRHDAAHHQIGPQQGEDQRGDQGDQDDHGVVAGQEHELDVDHHGRGHGDDGHQGGDGQLVAQGAAADGMQQPGSDQADHQAGRQRQSEDRGEVAHDGPANSSSRAIRYPARPTVRTSRGSDGSTLDLFPESSNVHGDGRGVAELPAPDPPQQLFLAVGLARVRGQEGQQIELAGGQGEGAVTEPGRVHGEVDDDRPGRDDLVDAAMTRPAARSDAAAPPPAGPPPAGRRASPRSRPRRSPGRPAGPPPHPAPTA